MISQTAEYALRAVVYLAMNPGDPYTTEQIARGTKVPPAYLSKVLQSLSRAGIVQSQRGIRGGFTLIRPPEDLSLLEVVNAVEPLQRIETCPLGLSTHGSNLCSLHKRLDEAAASVEHAFRKTTLHELLASPTASIPLCEGRCAL